MKNLDLRNITPDQESVLRNIYRYIRQRAVWLRTQKKIDDENKKSKNHTLSTGYKTEAGLNCEK